MAFQGEMMPHHRLPARIPFANARQSHDESSALTLLPQPGQDRHPHYQPEHDRQIKHQPLPASITGRGLAHNTSCTRRSPSLNNVTAQSEPDARSVSSWTDCQPFRSDVSDSLIATSKEQSQAVEQDHGDFETVKPSPQAYPLDTVSLNTSSGLISPSHEAKEDNGEEEEEFATNTAAYPQGQPATPARPVKTSFDEILGEQESRTREIEESEDETPSGSPLAFNSLQPTLQTIKMKANRLSLFGQAKNQKPLPPPPIDEDELLDIDVHAALFPPGSTDLPTPEAVKDLQRNAEAIINKLHSAYRSRTFALHDALHDKASQADQLEETQMRVTNLRAQLDGMAERVSEQELQMQALAEELRVERYRNKKLEAAASAAFAAAGRANASPVLNEVEEDLQQRQDNQSKRVSNGTMFTTDSGFESGDDTDTQSIFSRSNDAMSSASTIITTPPIPPYNRGRERMSEIRIRSSSPAPSVASSRMSMVSSKPTIKPSTYEKVLKGNTSSGFAGMFKTSRCSNCSGVSASDAWSIINIMRDENHGLKGRISDLEAAMEDVITLVGG